MPHAVLTAHLQDVATAMRRPRLLQRADEMFPHATGHVLAAMATAMQDQADGFRCVAQMKRFCLYQGRMASACAGSSCFSMNRSMCLKLV